MHTYWHKQNPDRPLYPDLLWSRPESKQRAGKLLIIGGNSFGFSAVGEAFASAQAAGIGNVRVLLPEALRKTIGKTLDNAEFAASTPSGSFSQQALSEWLAQAEWADGVLLAGNFGHNSETTILFEGFLSKYAGQVTLAGDTLDLACTTPDLVCRRLETLVVATLPQLQKLASAVHYEKAVKQGMDLLQLVELLHAFTERFKPAVITEHQGSMIVAVNGHVSTTKHDGTPNLLGIAATADVWWLQTPDKPFEALTTSILNSQAGAGGGT